jgi:hypothetical protein
MAKQTAMAMDGFSKVKPLNEGYVVKGGVNTTTRITTRPPPPAPMRPAASGTTAAAKPSR